MSKTTQIQVTAADNEIMLIASTPAGSSTLLHYKSGYNKPVDITVYPDAVLAPGTYDLTMIGVNWGGPGRYEVKVTSGGSVQTYSGGSQETGVDWSKTISMQI